MHANSLSRRRHQRLALPPMYSAVRVRFLHDEKFSLEGHAYDISEGGAQFELDQAIDPGTPIALEIMLPHSFGAEEGVDGPGRAIFVLGNVVWIDDSEAGPVRLAMAFTRFARE
ncbi:MAG: PilZ domain-containing protein, partial [Phycisphaerales bacterium]